MSGIKILDCTLRDGGYINNWKFGKETIHLCKKKSFDEDGHFSSAYDMALIAKELLDSLLFLKEVLIIFFAFILSCKYSNIA